MQLQNSAMAIGSQTVRSFSNYMTNVLNRYPIRLLKNIEKVDVHLGGTNTFYQPETNIVRHFITNAVRTSSSLPCRSSYWTANITSERFYSKGKEKGDKSKCPKLFPLVTRPFYSHFKFFHRKERSSAN